MNYPTAIVVAAAMIAGSVLLSTGSQSQSQGPKPGYSIAIGNSIGSELPQAWEVRESDGAVRACVALGEDTARGLGPNAMCGQWIGGRR